MSEEITKIIIAIQGATKKNNFLEMIYDQIEKLTEVDVAGESVDALLQLMENNPKLDYGMPGPIVHFVEQFDEVKYDEKLIKSVRRYPTMHTVWMLNRIINGLEGIAKDTYLNELKLIIDSNVSTSEVKELAIDFLNHQ